MAIQGSGIDPGRANAMPNPNQDVESRFDPRNIGQKAQNIRDDVFDGSLSRGKDMYGRNRTIREKMFLGSKPGDETVLGQAKGPESSSGLVTGPGELLDIPSDQGQNVDKRDI